MTSPAIARVRDLGELLRLLPYVLGFQPGRCALCVVFEHNRLVLVQRVPVPSEGWDSLGRDALLPCGRTLAGPPGRSAVLVGWEDEPDESLAGLAALARLCAAAGVGVEDVVVVRGRRWWPVTSRGVTGIGRALPPADTVPAVAELVGLGCAPLADRRDLERLFDPDATRVPRVRDALAAARRRRARDPRAAHAAGLDAWAELTRAAHVVGDRRGPPEVDPAVLGAALAFLDDVDQRDDLLAWAAPDGVPFAREHLPGGAGLRAALPGRVRAGGVPDAAQRRAMFVRVARSAPPGSRAPILTVCGVVGWAEGHGAFAETATRLALLDDPTYTLAILLRAAVEHGIRFDVPGGRDRQGPRPGSPSPERPA